MRQIRTIKELKRRLQAAWQCLTGRVWFVCIPKRNILGIYGSLDRQTATEMMVEGYMCERFRKEGLTEYLKQCSVRCEMIETIMYDPTVFLLSETEQGDITASYAATGAGTATPEDIAGAAEAYAELLETKI